MKWYFASRTRHQPDLLLVRDFLKKKGEEVTADWLDMTSLKPYEENIPRSQKFASETVESVLRSDVFVLIGDAEGTDMFVELGVALSKQGDDACHIYGVGEHARRSVLQLHSGITHVDFLREVLEKEEIDLEGFDELDISF